MLTRLRKDSPEAAFMNFPQLVSRGGSDTTAVRIVVSDPEFPRAASWIELSLGWVPGPIASLIKNSRLPIFHPFDAQLSEATQGAASRIFSTLPWLYRSEERRVGTECRS